MSCVQIIIAMQAHFDHKSTSLLFHHTLLTSVIATSATRHLFYRCREAAASTLGTTESKARTHIGIGGIAIYQSRLYDRTHMRFTV